MPEEKQPQSVVIAKDCLYTSGFYGNRHFTKGEKLNIIPNQKEDFTKAGVSKAFIEKSLKFHKHI